MSDTEEPGTCPFCAWDHPGDTHSKACVIGRHVDFAHTRGVADERARVVADLRKQNQLVYPSARFLANRYERGEHEEAT